MILLHLILSNYPSLPDSDLLEDVEKSLRIFTAMNDIIVARRCAEMIREVLDVARTCLRRRRGFHAPDQAEAQAHPRSGVVCASTATGMEICSQTGVNASLPAQNQHSASADKGAATGVVPQGVSSVPTPAPGLLLEAPSSVLGQNGEGEGGDFFFSLFSSDTQMQTDRTRAEMLANLVDSSVLEDFAFGGENEFSFF